MNAKDYYIMTTGKLIHGDALDVLPTLDADSVDVVFCDWPYSQMSPVRGKDVGAAGRIFGPNAFLNRILTEAKRVAAPGCHLYVFGDWRGIPDTGYALSTTGWYPTTVLVWDKEFVGTGGFWRSGWDPIWFASKGPADKRTDHAYQNVIRAKVDRDREHPAQKPAALWEKLCMVSVTPGKRVLDLFAGSKSSQTPTEARGGIWTGIEIDGTWAKAS